METAEAKEEFDIQLMAQPDERNQALAGVADTGSSQGGRGSPGSQ